MILESKEDIIKSRVKEPVLKTDPTIVQGQEKIDVNPKDKEVDVAFASVANNGYIKRFVPYYIYRPPFGFPRRDIDLLNCRRLAKTPFVFSVIKTLLDEISAAKWDIVANEGFKEEEVEAQVKKIKEFFYNPNGNNQSFRAILRGVCRDIFELDAGVIEKVYNRRGELTQLYTVDGSTILLNPDEHGYLGNRIDYVPVIDFNTLQHNQEAIAHYYTNYLKEQAGYFQYNWTGGIWPVPFGKKELIYIMANDNTDSIYGTSPIQVLYNILLILLYGSQVNLDMYANNNIPTGMLVMLDANKDQIDATRQHFQTHTQQQDMYGNNVKKFFNVPISPKEISYVDFSFKAKDMQMLEQQKWYQQLVWSVFGVTPDEMGACYSQDTRILTDTGFKYYFELSLIDKIATINEKTKELEFICPSSIHTYYVENRPFHHYLSSGVDILVSTNHRMFYRTPKLNNYIMSESKNIKQNKIRLLQGGLNWNGVNIDKIIIPKINYLNPKDKNRHQQTEFNISDFCEFLGYYLSEGSVLKKMNSKKSYAIKISQTNKENIKIMHPLLKKLKFRREKTNWCLNNKSLATYLFEFGSANEKYIPELFKNLTKEKLTILLDALILGDGYREKDGNSIKYTTSSKRLASDVLEIMCKLGYKTRLNTRFFNNSKWKTSYTVYGNKKYYEPNITISKHRKNLNYTGIMWCPHVQNRPFITERNGKIGINYNTDSSNRSTANEQSRIFKRKALAPIFKLLEYHFNTQLVWELDPTKSVQFKFDDYDIESEFRKAELNEKLLNTTWTLNEIRKKDNMEKLEGEEYDKPKGLAPAGGFGSDMFSGANSNDNQANKDDVKNEERSPEKEDKLFKRTDDDSLTKKSIDTDVPKRTDLEKTLITNYKDLEKQILEMIE